MNTPSVAEQLRTMRGHALPHPQKQERAGPTPMKRTPMPRAPKPVKQRVIADVEWPKCADPCTLLSGHSGRCLASNGRWVKR